jgi:hypothetical protein
MKAAYAVSRAIPPSVEIQAIIARLAVEGDGR